MDTKIAARLVRMQEWAAIIQDRLNSGMTIKKYCEINNIRKTHASTGSNSSGKLLHSCRYQETDRFLRIQAYHTD